MLCLNDDCGGCMMVRVCFNVTPPLICSVFCRVTSTLDYIRSTKLYSCWSLKVQICCSLLRPCQLLSTLLNAFTAVPMHSYKSFKHFLFNLHINTEGIGQSANPWAIREALIGLPYLCLCWSYRNERDAIRRGIIPWKRLYYVCNDPIHWWRRSERMSTLVLQRVHGLVRERRQ